jgi:ElaB/YqjD/DUF883 family membrane-anchored ribosome-binding protein
MARPESCRFVGINRRKQQAAQVRRAKALELRLQGCTITQIAEQLQVDVSTAHRDIERQLAELSSASRERCEQLREVAHLRLEELIAALWEDRSDPAANRQIARCVEIELRLYGLLESEAQGRPTIELSELRALILERQKAAIARAAAAGITLEVPALPDRPRGNDGA